MNEVTTYFLEMKSPSALIEKANSEGLEVRECEVKEYQFNRFLYQFIGKSWHWVDKLTWSDEIWEKYVASENLRTWVAYYLGSPAGYYELHRKDNGDVEIAYFGLAHNFIGKGHGSFLLSHAISSAWAWEGSKRVWVHTCTHDHPSALQNYKARGLQVYKEETA